MIYGTFQQALKCLAFHATFHEAFQSESFSLLYSFALLYAELEDHSQAFINFMEAVSNDEVNGLDCEDLFWKCTTEDDYILR